MTERRRSEVPQTALGFRAHTTATRRDFTVEVGKPLPNGAVVVAAEPNGEYVVVLAVRDAAYVAQYATWKVDPDTGNASWGDYFVSFGEAVRDFNERVAN